MSMYTHTCRCGAQYEDEDPEPYFCPACVLKRKSIAAEIDAKRAAEGPRPPPMSALQEYDASQKVHGFVITKL